MVLTRCHSPPAPTLMAKIDRHSRSSSPMLQIYVLSVLDISEVCCILFHMDVAKVDRGWCIRCKCFRDMLQEFVQNVSSIPDVCCKRFDLDVAYVSHICCNKMFQLF